MLCLHCSLPTSDPRAPEQREPHSLLTDIDWTPGVSSDSPETDGRPPGSSPKPPESHRRQPRPSPRSANRDTRVAGTAPATVQVRTQRPSGTSAEEPDECDPHPCQPSRERPAEGQPAHTTATTTAPPETQQRPYTILRSTGKKSPQHSLETHLRLRTATAERAPRGTPGPRRLGPAAQHWHSWSGHLQTYRKYCRNM